MTLNSRGTKTNWVNLAIGGHKLFNSMHEKKSIDQIVFKDNDESKDKPPNSTVSALLPLGGNVISKPCNFL